MTTTEIEQRSSRSVEMTVDGGVAMIRLDQRHRPVNVLSADLVEDLAVAIGRLEAGEARAAVIISDKPGVWIAGADIDELKDLDSAADAERVVRTAHGLLNRLEALAIPVVAAINGAALGGGLETALACGYRIATDSPRTKLGLPEVQLGLLPGAGGTQRLPRLIGLGASLDLMLTGKRLDARRARKAGIVDEVVPEAALEGIARRVALDLADQRVLPRAARPRGSPLWYENLPGLRAFIFRKARASVVEKTRGLYPAPLRILEVVQRGIDLPLDEALAVETRAFGDLAVTPEARALIHVFLTTTAARNDPGLPPTAVARDIERVGIVGAGFMGAGIATVAAENGSRVRLKDVSPETVARGFQAVTKALRKRAEKRRRRGFEITALLDRVEATAEYTGFTAADLMIEAVFEDLELKHRIIREIEASSGEETIIASNTSTIPIHLLAEATARPGNFIGLHFFSPVEKMPLLEMIVTPETDASITASCHRWGKRIGKTPIIVNDAPGFYVNRILGPYMNEAAILLEEGVAIEEIDAAMLDWGFPVGPITLYDEVGLDVATKSGKILQEAFGRRIPGNAVLPRMVADERLGRKNGRGFFLYENGKKAGPDETVYALIGVPERRSVPRHEIQERLALGMVNEAARCLDESVLRSARDGDVGAVMGIGFPPFRGGPFWYVEETGAGAVLDRLRALETRFGPRFAPAPWLIERAASSG